MHTGDTSDDRSVGATAVVDDPRAARGARELTITDPRDGTVVGHLTVAGDDEVDAAVARARAAWPAWRATPAADRGAAVRRAADALEARAGELAEVQQRETGRLRDEALGGIEAAVGTLRQYAELGPLHRGRSLLGGPSAADLMRPEPRGVLAAVTPWNDPVAIAAGLIGAALVTGNVVVHKPSERCPHLGRLLGEVLAAHLPTDVLVTVTGAGHTGERLVASTDVDIVAHVGSSATGEAIALAAARTGAHVVRENGGNDPLIVDAGVDPGWAARQAAIGAFTNAGQICTSVERIFVHEAVADEFVDRLTAEADDRNRTGALPPLVDERMRTAVHAHVEAAIAAGSRALVGGAVPERPGCHYPATVLSGCTPDMTVFAEETFGPIAPVMVVADFDEALERAVADSYGLAATVLTPNMAHAHQAIDALPVGTVKINAVFGGAPGGSAEPRGRSGRGVGYGPELLDEFTTAKVVHLEAAVTPKP